MSAVQDIDAISGKFGDAVVGTNEFRGEQTISVKLESLHAVLEHARKDLGYDFILDISSLDHFGEDPRFEMVYELTTVNDSKHLRVKAKVGEEQEVPSATDLWLGADWHEREVFDMMGIKFSDHPDLRRILMWEGFPFYPLRKDFPLAGRPSEMPDVAFSGVAPLEGGPFVTAPGTADVAKREPRSREMD
ncbi:MAG: NADH-quinone oxidoreductase subunit C [Verrucomicrobiota bacterium]